MEAGSRLRRAASQVRRGAALISGMVGVVAGLAFAAANTTSHAANFRTQNFLVQAPSPALARQVGEAAERYRNDLATYWLGRPLPAWPTPCPVRVVAGPNLAAQGVTTYNRAPVRDFQMEVVGTPERILDSVLPHEVTHTVLATHFGRPLPRWADEGICTTVEHESEKNKHEMKLREFLSNRRGIAMNRLFLLTEYPSDVLPMYAQGYSVCRFLIEQKDAPTFIQFLSDYMQSPSWTASVKKHYGYDSLAELQQYWLAWVSEGSGSVERFAKVDRTQPLSVPSSSVAAAAAMGPATAMIGQASPVRQAGLSNQATFNGQAPLSNPTTLNGPANVGSSSPVALASTTAGDGSGGWYQRKRNEAVDGDPQMAAAPTAATPMVPPSVRASGRYKSAQPQPEMRLSRGGQWIEPAAESGQPIRATDPTNWADGSARYR